MWYLESNFTKEEIIELYFNVVEFGPSIYGIQDAARHYFGREPSDLNLIESVFLIKLLPSPVSRYRMYEKGELSQRQLTMLQRVLKVMKERNRISGQEYTAALEQTIEFHHEGDPLPEPRSPLVRQARPYAELSDGESEASLEMEETYE